MARIVEPEKAPPVTPREDFGKKVQAHVRYVAEDGKQVPGVTTIIGVLAKPALVGWANKLGLQGIDVNKYVDETAATGSLAHYLIECELGDVEPQLNDYTPDQVSRARHSLQGFHQWRASHALQPELVEIPLVSEVFRYGGTIDCYGLLDEVPTLLDFKTSSGIYDEHKFQVAAYWRLLQEHGHQVKGVRILRIGRSEHASLEEHIFSGHDVLAFWKIFEAALEIYYLKRGLKG